MKKTISICILVFALVMSTPCFVLADEVVPVTPRYTYVKEVTAAYDVNTLLGVVYCVGSGDSLTANHIKVSVFLEYYNETTGRWVLFKSWSNEGTYSVITSGYKAIYSGYDYRVRTITYAYDSNNKLLEMASATIEFYY